MTDWSETAVQTAGIATAAKAADTRQKNRILGVSASYSVVTDAGTLEVKFGATVVLTIEVHPGDTVDLTFKRTAAVNEAISAVLAASTGDGQVTIWGDDHGAVFPAPAA